MWENWNSLNQHTPDGMHFSQQNRQNTPRVWCRARSGRTSNVWGATFHPSSSSDNVQMHLHTYKRRQTPLHTINVTWEKRRRKCWLMTDEVRPQVRLRYSRHDSLSPSAGKKHLTITPPTRHGTLTDVGVDIRWLAEAARPYHIPTNGEETIEQNTSLQSCHYLRHQGAIH